MAKQLQIAIHMGNQERAFALAAKLGIPQQELSMEADAAKNAQRLQEMKEKGVEAVRPNRGDTGRNLWQKEGGLRNVTLNRLLEDLQVQCYRIVHAFVRSAPVRDHNTGRIRPGLFKTVLRFIFDQDQTPPVNSELPQDLEARLRTEIGDETWGTVEVWKNASSDTVNVKHWGTKSTRANILRFASRSEDAPDEMRDGMDVRGNFAYIVS